MGEYTHHTSDKGLISKIYKEIIILNTPSPQKTYLIKKCVKDLNRRFSKEDVKMANRHIKRCSKSLIIRNLKIKTTMRYHTTHVRMAIINKSTNSKYWQGYRESETLFHCQWERRLVQSLWKAVWSYPPKLKMELPYDPAIPPLGISLMKPKTLIQKNISTPMFIASLFTISKICKQPKCPSVDEQIKQVWHIYTMEYYLAVKKKKILPFVTSCMDL